MQGSDTSVELPQALTRLKFSTPVSFASCGVVSRA
ncbi:hypothetical protein EVA_13891 [gut metagenome]|uniref:Uncharacterized protein n=1 Tax=gut metagenome TaxID=749906 RepID=J9FU08_9ZZZZ